MGGGVEEAMSKLVGFVVYETIGFTPHNFAGRRTEDIGDMPPARQARVRAYVAARGLKFPCTVPDEVIDGIDEWEKE